MKEIVTTCDIEDKQHSFLMRNIELDVIFDHDQEDGKSKTSPYFERMKLDMCSDCIKYMMENRRYVYAYGAMGYNKYYLKGQSNDK